MARRKDPFSQKSAQLPKILQFLLFFPYLLVVIGDVVIFLIKAVFSVPVATYNISKNAVNKLLRAATSWGIKKISRLRPEKKLGRPPKKRSVTVFTRGRP